MLHLYKLGWLDHRLVLLESKSMYCSIVFVAPLHGAKAYQLANVAVQLNMPVNERIYQPTYITDDTFFLSSNEIELAKEASVFKFQKGLLYFSVCW